MKRILVLALAVMMLVGIGVSVGAKEAKQEIVWAMWDDPAAQGFNEIIARFEEKYPNITVTAMQIPYERYEDKIRTVLAAGDPPDVIQINDDYVVDYTRRNLILPLTRYVEMSDYTRDEMYTAVWDFPWVDGEMMAWNGVNKVRAFVYNVDLFKKAGLPMLTTQWEDPDWNWDTLLEYAKKLTIVDGNGMTSQYGVSIFHDGGAEQMWTFNNQGHGLFSADGKELAAAWPEGVEGLQYLADLSNKWNVQPRWGSLKQVSADNLFLTGKLGMMMTGSWSVPILRRDADFEWDAAPMPMKKYGRQEGSLVCFGIPRRAKNPDDSWKLLDFIASAEAQEIWAKNGYGVPLRPAYGDLYIQPGLPPANQQVWLDGMDFHQSVHFTQHTQRAKQLFRVQLELVWIGQKTAAEAMETSREEVERALLGEY